MFLYALRNIKFEQQITTFRYISKKQSAAMLYTSVLDMLGARVGIQKKALYQLADQMSFSLKEVAGYLSMSVPTYPDEDLLDYPTSERVIKTAQLYQKGFEVFGEGKFKIWMYTPSKALGGKKPLQLLHTTKGVEYLLDEVIRIEHGIFA
jgi:putative toxin-antitoxin system antitoxin component (TIGR02293 family)